MNSKLRNFLIAAAFTAGCAMGQANASFVTIETWSDTFGKCGTPGWRECSNLKCAPASGNTLRIDPYTAQSWCDLPTPACTAFPIPVNYANPDVTFLVLTDLHLLNGYSITDPNHVLHAFNITHLPSMGFNWSNAGAGFDDKALGTPVAVVTTGDDTDYGQQVDLGAYRLLYESGTSSDSINYPTFPGLGNHDVDGLCPFANCSRRMFDYTAAAVGCAANVDSASHNYSWDWGPFHMVQLNKWAGDTSLGSDEAILDGPALQVFHGSGLTWLAEDLATHVGTSGRQVILFQHFGWDYFSTTNNTGMPSSAWWTEGDRTALLNILAPYNIAALFSGHQHVASMNSAAYLDPQGNPKILDDFTGGTGGIDVFHTGDPTGEFFAVRLTNNFLDVLPFKWSATAPSTLLYMNDVGVPDSFYPAFFNDVKGCRKWIGEKLQPVPVTISFNGSNGVKITNNSGAVIKGPFALQLNSLPSGGTLNSVSFMGSCAQGPSYQEFAATQLEPGQGDEITLTISNFSKALSSNYRLSDFQVVTLGGDSLIASQSSVTVTAQSPQPVVLSTVFGRNTGFTYQVIGAGLTVSANSAQTPATLIIGVNPSAVKVAGSGFIAITPTDPQYLPLNIQVTLGPVPITVKSNTGDPVTVDGQSYPTPHTFNWLPGGSHSLDAPIQLESLGTQDRFLSWADGGAQARQVTAPPIPTTYTANYQRYYLVTPAVSPSSAGVVSILPSSVDGYYATGTSVTVEATPLSGFAFSTFQGVTPTPASNSFSATVNSPLTFTAVFAALGSYAITTDLSFGGQETVDGKAYNGLASVKWISGSSHKISVPMQFDSSPGTRYVFANWSNGGTTAAQTITAGAITNYVAHYQPQYLISTAVSPVGGGTLTGGGWYAAGASATLLATAAAGFQFAGFSGNASGNQDPLALTVGQPDSLVANFQPGTPSLYASGGPRNDSDPNVSAFTFLLSNTGVGGAANAQIDSVTAQAVLGSGNITVTSLPLLFGTILPGQSASQTMNFNWPSTATRASFTVNFSANGGAYHGQSTFYLFR